MMWFLSGWHWLLPVLALAAAAAIVGGWLLLREPPGEAAELEAHLDALDPAKVPVLQTADLDRPDPVPGAGMAAGPPPVPAPDDTPGAVDRGPARLTPAPRRRAVHKGRIPHSLPGPASVAREPVR